MKVSVAIVKLGIVFNILWLFTEIMNLKQRNAFCCQVVMGMNPHPSIFSKDNISGGCDVKVYFMHFHFIFFNFVEIYKVVLVL